MIDAVEIFRKNWEQCWGQATAARDKEIARLVLKAKTLEIGAASLGDSLMALLPPTVAKDGMRTMSDGSVLPAVTANAMAKKRAAVQATSTQAHIVLQCLIALGEPVTAKQLRGSTGLGPKTLGAALGMLFKSGNIDKMPGRKWKVSAMAAANAAVQNGVDAEVGSKD